MAFRGTFDYTLDAKNRLTVPAKFRASLSDGVVLAKGIERCVADLAARRTTTRYIAGRAAGRAPAVAARRASSQRFFSRQLARHRARLRRAASWSRRFLHRARAA